MWKLNKLNSSFTTVFKQKRAEQHSLHLLFNKFATQKVVPNKGIAKKKTISRVAQVVTEVAQAKIIKLCYKIFLFLRDAVAQRKLSYFVRNPRTDFFS